MAEHFVQVPWSIEDSDLDPYQFRLWVHVKRVGVCWQTVRTIADACKMSVGKASETRKWLAENGYLQKAIDEKTGRVGFVACSPHEQTQQDCSPHEQERSPHEQDVHDMNNGVHHMNAILRRTHEEEHSKKNTEEDDGARARAEEAAIELLDYWQDLSGSFAPADEERRALDYIGPLNRLWIRVGRDLGEAKRLLQEKRDDMLGEGKTPYRPAAIVPAIFAELDGVQPRASPNGTHADEAQPESNPDNWKRLDPTGARM